MAATVAASSGLRNQLAHGAAGRFDGAALVRAAFRIGQPVRDPTPKPGKKRCGILASRAVPNTA